MKWNLTWEYLASGCKTYEMEAQEAGWCDQRYIPSVWYMLRIQYRQIYIDHCHLEWGYIEKFLVSVRVGGADEYIMNMSEYVCKTQKMTEDEVFLEANRMIRQYFLSIMPT